MRLINILKAVVYSPVLLFLYGAYLSSSKKSIIDEDLSRLTNVNSWGGIIKQLLLNKEFRNVVYYRLGSISYLPGLILKPNPTLHIMTKEIGPGLIVVHGDSTYINARSIGKNFYINQCATVGVIGKDAPVIGDNVRVATGAIVLGKITVGDNINIGAGAVVVKNIPDNCTVVGNPARIVKMNGKRVEKELYIFDRKL